MISACDLVQAGERVQQRRLAGARRAHDGEELALRDDQVETVERRRRCRLRSDRPSGRSPRRGWGWSQRPPSGECRARCSPKSGAEPQAFGTEIAFELLDLGCTEDLHPPCRVDRLIRRVQGTLPGGEQLLIRDSTWLCVVRLSSQGAITTWGSAPTNEPTLEVLRAPSHAAAPRRRRLRPAMPG